MHFIDFIANPGSLRFMGFDEIYGEKGVRPLYRRPLQDFLNRSEAEQKNALKIARARVNGDASFLPMIRQLSIHDYEAIVAGVKQRGRALQKFLTEVYLGTASYEEAGAISSAKLAKIRARYQHREEQGGLGPENIQFWYAPDIIRGRDGKFRVIEDNVGFVGGIGDLEALADAAAALGVVVPPTFHPQNFYRIMRERYERDALLAGGGKVILLSYAQSQRANHEDLRLARALGPKVTHVTNFRAIKVRADGVYHRGERVGFVIVNLDAQDIDPLGSSPYRISRFWQAVSKGQVGVSYAPGFEFIGDKYFYGFVNALVKHYGGEDCLVPSLAIFEIKGARAFSRLKKQRVRWVIKACRSQGGKSVWVGAYLSQKSWESLLRRIAKSEDSFIAQRFVEPSQFMERSVDYRPLALIFPDEEIVSPILWGRAASGEKKKTNIAQGGLLAPILVSPLGFG